MQALQFEATVDPDRPDRIGAANQWLSNPHLRMTDVAEPQITSANDLIIKPKVNGICGTDLHVTEAGPDGYVKFSGPAVPRVVLGHEFVGTVVDTGKSVSRFKKGDIVAAESIQGCGSCRPCLRGHFNQCENIELLGLTIDGALARYVRAKENHCHLVEPILERFGMSRGINMAVLLEPLGCAFCGLFVDHWGDKWNSVRPGETAAVFGVGPIGLGAVSLLRNAGVEQVLAFDVKQERIERAMKLGATAAYNISALPGGCRSLGELINEQTQGRGLDVAIEAAGAPELFEPVLGVLGARARFIYLGRTPEKALLDTNILLSKGITLKGSRGHAGYNIFPTLIRLIADGRLNLEGFVTAHFNFQEALAAFDRAREQRDGKILIHLEN